ncbi:MAG TPA: hypothetical protein H9902_12330 [Candidatus Stackebrandtia faecavium]|nr:hypothetical protein [Candidatus Stackebrandtia faecavium]
MANLDEFSSQVAANIQSVNETMQQIDASKSTCDELTSSFASLGNESIPGTLEQAKTKLEEAINQASAQVKNLEEVQNMIEAAKQA